MKLNDLVYITGFVLLTGSTEEELTAVTESVICECSDTDLLLEDLNEYINLDDSI